MINNPTVKRNLQIKNERIRFIIDYTIMVGTNNFTVLQLMEKTTFQIQQII